MRVVFDQCRPCSRAVPLKGFELLWKPEVVDCHYSRGLADVVDLERGAQPWRDVIEHGNGAGEADRGENLPADQTGHEHPVSRTGPGGAESIYECPTSQ